MRGSEYLAALDGYANDYYSDEEYEEEEDYDEPSLKASYDGMHISLADLVVEKAAPQPRRAKQTRSDGAKEEEEDDDASFYRRSSSFSHADESSANLASFNDVSAKDYVEFTPSGTAQRMRWETVDMGVFMPRFSHSATVFHDKATKKPQLLVWGGANSLGNCLARAQALCLETLEWRNVNVKGQQPVPRTGHSACLDHTGSRIIIVGGVSPRVGRLAHVDVLHGVGTDNLRWNVQHAAQLNFTKPVPYEHPVQVDAEWCGCPPAAFMNGWRLDQKRKDREYHQGHWRRYPIDRAGADMPALSHHTCVRRGQLFYIYGGFDVSAVPSSEVYVLDFHSWGHRVRLAQDIQRAQHKVGNTVKRNYGVTVDLRCKERYLTVRRLKCRGSAPEGGRAAHAAVLMNSREMWVLGGVGPGGVCSNELHAFDVFSHTWTRKQLSGAQIPPLAYHQMEALSGRRLLVFGGRASDTPLAFVWIISEHLVVSQVNITGAQPRPRGSHSLNVFGDSAALLSGFGRALVPSQHILRHVHDSSAFSSGLGADMRTLLDDTELSDVAFCVEGRMIHAHRVILSARSHTFRDIFSDPASPDLITVEEGETHEAWFTMLSFIYSDRVSLTQELAPELVRLAQKYQLQQLESIARSCFEPTLIGPSTLNSDLAWALHSGHMCSDLTIKAAGGEWAAHRAVVAARSTYFASMLKSGFREAETGVLVLPEMHDRDAFDAVLRYVYTDHLDVEDVQLLFNIMCNSAIFAITSLLERCEEVLISFVEQDNLVVLFEAADTYGASLLREECRRYALRNFNALSLAGELSALDPTLLKELCSVRDEMGLKSALGAQDGASGADGSARYLDVEGIACPKCELPFVYRPREWRDIKGAGLTPKDMARSLAPELEYSQHVVSVGHAAKVRLPTGGTIISKRGFPNKKVAEQNVALMAYHHLACGIEPIWEI